MDTVYLAGLGRRGRMAFISVIIYSYSLTLWLTVHLMIISVLILTDKMTKKVRHCCQTVKKISPCSVLFGKQ